jgi:hypothetical protein
MFGAKQTFWVSKDGGPPQPCIDLDYAIGLGYRECEPPPAPIEETSKREAQAVAGVVLSLGSASVRNGVVDNSAAVQMPQGANLKPGRRRRGQL